MMNLEASILDLSHQLAERLAQQTRELLAEAQAEISRLQLALQEQTSRREQAEEELQSLQRQLAAMACSLEGERQARQQAQEELGAVHDAILSQLEQAEAEHGRQLELEAERERQWHQQLERQRQAWLEEKGQRELLEQRIHRFRMAAGELLALDLAPAAAVPLESRLEALPLVCSN